MYLTFRPVKNVASNPTYFSVLLKVILYSYLILKKMNERITDS